MPIAAGNAPRRPGAPLLPDPVRGDEHRRLRRRRRARARAGRARSRSRTSPASAGSGRSWAARWRCFMFGFIGLPAGRPLPRQVLRLRRRVRPRLDLARLIVGVVDSGHLDLLLPRRHPRDVHAPPGARGRRRAGGSPPRDRRSSPRGRRSARSLDRQLRLRRAAPRHRADAVAFLPFPVAAPSLVMRVVVLGAGVAGESLRRRACAARRDAEIIARRARAASAASAPTGPAFLRRPSYGRSSDRPRAARPGRGGGRRPRWIAAKVFGWRDEISEKDDTSQAMARRRSAPSVVRGTASRRRAGPRAVGERELPYDAPASWRPARRRAEPR